MNLRPLFNKVFLELPVEEKVTKSGIFIPDTVGNEDPVQAEVVAVGPGRLNDKNERVPMAVKVGDKVLVRKYGLREAEVSGKKYLIGDEDDILAVIEG
ncbi:MAG: co-chaperone GroES [Patescibacteria group bacterium]